MNIGVPSSGYAYRRNVLGLVPGANYVSTPDNRRIIAALGNRINRRLRREIVNTTDLSSVYAGAARSDVDVYHLFNAISLGATPWVTTFETMTPRVKAALQCHHGTLPSFRPVAGDPAVALGVQRLADPSCRAAIALSENAAAIERDLLSEFPEQRDAVEGKLHVVHPPQRVLAENRERAVPGPGDPVTFMLVGTNFFIKGGREAIEVLQRLRDEHGYPIRLVIVSAMVADTYATATGRHDVVEALARIDSQREWVTHHRSLPNQDVLELMRTADVGLMPSYSETYGYSMLEFQASGVPVISTDVRALPEINPERCGWLISVPRNRLGVALFSTESQREALSRAIADGLEAAVHAVFAERSSIAEKSAHAVERIRAAHSPEDVGRRLSALYCG